MIASTSRNRERLRERRKLLERGEHVANLDEFTTLKIFQSREWLCKLRDLGSLSLLLKTCLRYADNRVTVY